MPDLLKVLILEDVSSDAELVKVHLEDLEYQCAYKVTDKKEEYLRLLHDFEPDIVISDFNLPRFDGLQALRLLKEKNNLTPFIFVTGTLGEENAVEAIRSGATDFIIKNRVEHLAAAVIRALREKEEKKVKENYAKQLEANALFVSALLRYDQWEKALHDAFEIVGNAVEADSVYYFAYCRDNFIGEKLIDQQIRWSKDDAKLLLCDSGLPQTPLAVYEEFMPTISESLPYQSIVGQLPPNTLKKALVRENVLSFLILPIFVKDTFHGFLRFDDCSRERVWAPEEIAFLETFSFNLAVAVEKRISDIAVKESEQRFKTVISNIPGITYRCMPDRNWTMQFISDEVERMTGFPAGDFIFNQKRTFASIIHPEDLERTYSVRDQLINNDTFNLEYRIICADGSYRWVEERGLGIYEENGNLQYIDGVIMDVTESRNLTFEISQQNEALREIAWTQSHVVRAPLARLKGLVNLLEIGRFDLLNQQETLKLINASANELDDIIRQIVRKIEVIERD